MPCEILAMPGEPVEGQIYSWIVAYKVTATSPVWLVTGYTNPEARAEFVEDLKRTPYVWLVFDTVRAPGSGYSAGMVKPHQHRFQEFADYFTACGLPIHLPIESSHGL